SSSRLSTTTECQRQFSCTYPCASASNWVVDRLINGNDSIASGERCPLIRLPSSWNRAATVDSMLDVAESIASSARTGRVSAQMMTYCSHKGALGGACSRSWRHPSSSTVVYLPGSVALVCRVEDLSARRR